MTTAPRTIPEPSPADVDAVMTRLRATFASGRTREYEWRAEQLDRLSRMIFEHRDDFARALGADLRRTPVDASLFDLLLTRAEVVHARKHLKRWMRPERVHTPLNVMPGKSWFQRDPLGVALVIAPWNYPIYLAIAPLAAALAAGNCVVIKPSELTPACSALLLDLLPRYVDPDAVAVVEGGPAASLGLVDQAPDHILFTGSPAVGSVIMAAAAKHLTPVTLELGGKCPAIVTSSADLEIAARRIAFGKLANSGQTCVAPDYVLVDRSVRDEFVARMTSTLNRFSEGRAVPIVNRRHTERLDGLIHTANGRVTLGGAVDADTAVVEPTVILDPDADSAILREEIFGPVLPIVTVDSLDDAIAHVRRGSHPLASYVFTEEKSDEDRVIAELASGGTVINHVMLHLGVTELPFGGVGSSGMGRYHGKWGFDTFTNPRAVLRKPSHPDIRLFYPPYSRLAKRILNRLL